MAVRKRAIIIGLKVAGFQDDVRNMKSALADIGISGGDVVVLSGGDATKGNILKEIQRQANELELDDFLLFYFSGHGGRVADRNNDELDGYDETLCAAGQVILDDELWEAWRAFSDGVRLCILTDSCHSGTVPRLTSTRLPVAVSIVHMSGCADRQESMGADGRGGRFTNAFIRALKSNRNLNYVAFHQQIRQNLAQSGSQQQSEIHFYGGHTNALAQQNVFDWNASFV